VRGRLGKGGVPDQEAASHAVLNDWNSGSIPYYTAPPKFHPSSVPSVPKGEASLSVLQSQSADGTAVADQTMSEPMAHGTVLTTAADVGSAQYVSKFSKPFDLEGLFSLTDKAVLDDEEGGGMIVDDEVAGGFVPENPPLEESADTMDDEPPLPSVTNLQKRARSVSPSVASLSTIPVSNADSIPLRNTRPVKQPKPKRTRYNANAPIVFDAVETAAMVSSRKKQREQVKRRLKSALNATVTPLTEDFVLKTGTAFDALSVPLPGEDEDDDL